MSLFQVKDDYGWIIDHEHLGDDGEPCAPRPFGPVLGPRDAPDALIDGLKGGYGDRFKLYDDDGNLCLSGRILTVSGEHAWDEYEHIAFGPLSDYGEGGYGCTEIWYPSGDNGKWEQL